MNRFTRCALGIGLALMGCAAALAAPPLTVIQDILYNADGTAFNGLITVSWSAFEASDLSTIPAHSFSVEVVNGFVRIQLTPTTNAQSPSSYSVVYSSGTAQFTENWAVPPSNVSLPVSAVRINGIGSVVGGGSTAPPADTTSVSIDEVTGLSSALNLRPIMGSGYTVSRAAVIDGTGALAGAAGNSSDCLHVDGTSGACGTSSASGTDTSSTGFVDQETPSGAVDGVNAAFRLGQTPNPPASVSLFRNGVLLKQGLDYYLSSSTITFTSGDLPQPGDILTAAYRVNVSLAGVTFVDAETPGGTVDGSNTAFVLTQAPTPASSLSLYRNGMRLKPTLDFTLSGTGIVFQPGLAPQAGDVLLASYRVALSSN